MTLMNGLKYEIEVYFSYVNSLKEDHTVDFNKNTIKIMNNLEIDIQKKLKQLSKFEELIYK